MSINQKIIDTKALRHVFGTFCTGVIVVTVSGPEGVMGLTVNSFTSVSLNPALILWCLDKSSNRFDTYSKASEFGINVLAHDQEGLADRFSKLNPYFIEDEGLLSAETPLRIKGCIGWLRCHTEAVSEVGDHLLMVAKVSEADKADGAALGYFKGRYGVVS